MTFFSKNENLCRLFAVDDVLILREKNIAKQFSVVKFIHRNLSEYLKKRHLQKKLYILYSILYIDIYDRILGWVTFLRLKKMTLQLIF